MYQKPSFPKKKLSFPELDHAFETVPNTTRVDQARHVLEIDVLGTAKSILKTSDPIQFQSKCSSSPQSGHTCAPFRRPSRTVRAMTLV